MTAKAHPSRLKMGLLWGLLCLIAYGLVALEAVQKDSEGPTRRTTYSAAAGGYKALYLWLQALDVPVKRWERSLLDLPREATVLMIVEPELGPAPGELGVLEQWVAKGGTLVLVMRPPSPFMKRFGLEAAERPGRHDRGPGDKGLTGQPGPFTRGVFKVLSKGHPDLKSSRPEMVHHGRDAWGTLIAAAMQGQGRLIALADPAILSNESLSKGDHARLALNLLLTYRKEGTLLVDEYHHGYGRATSVLGYLGRSRALGPLLQGVFAVLILWAAAGRRFGPVRPFAKEEKRSSMEYVGAMARLFQRAGARGLALESVTLWIEDQARKFLVDGDRDLQAGVKRAREGLPGEDLTDRGLLLRVRALYEALAGARRRAS